MTETVMMRLEETTYVTDTRVAQIVASVCPVSIRPMDTDGVSLPKFPTGGEEIAALLAQEMGGDAHGALWVSAPENIYFLADGWDVVQSTDNHATYAEVVDMVKGKVAEPLTLLCWREGYDCNHGVIEPMDPVSFQTREEE